MPGTPDTIEAISLAEFEARREKARSLMGRGAISAVLLEPGSSMYYFTGVKWGLSERLTAAIMLPGGELAYICPAFEEERLRDRVRVEGDVYCWHEHESPFELVASILRQRGAESGPLGIESRVRFFVYDGIRHALPGVRCVSADRITVGCRAVKSAAEIALMQRAMDLTLAAYRQVIPLLREGITRAECLENAAAAHRELGVNGGIDFQFGRASSLPHGSPHRQVLKDGDVVLMDGGCTVEGYHSDISRTIVFGESTRRQREIWQLEQEAQAAAFAAAQVGAPCETVDAAARKVIVDAGLGPDYAVPGLPHRTGHGIGLDVHEAENMVRGNRTPLAPGMCFTNEPMIAIPGEFGVRLEDCVYITRDGPRWFTAPSPSIERPFV